MSLNDNTLRKGHAVGPSELRPSYVQQLLRHMEAMPYSRMPYHIRVMAQEHLPAEQTNFNMLSMLALSGMRFKLAQLPFTLTLAYGVRTCHLLPRAPL